MSFIPQQPLRRTSTYEHRTKQLRSEALMPAASSTAAAAPAKPRIPWDGDSAFAGGKTSIAILLEWLSAPGNGDRWRFGGVRVGSSGDALEPHFSKIELAREVVGVMATHGITHRLARDVRWKINALVRSHATAARFLEQFERQKRALLRDAPHAAHTQRTIESSEPRVLTHVHSLCPYFDVLDPILKGDSTPSPRAKERPSKRAGQKRRSDDDEEEDDDVEDDDDDSAPVPVNADHALINGLLGLDSGRHEPQRAAGSRKRRLERREHDDTDDDADEEDERQIERARRRARDDAEVQFTTRRRALQLENLELDNQVKKLQLEREKMLVAKELVLVRTQLRSAGYAQDDIDARFPMRPSGDMGR